MTRPNLTVVPPAPPPSDPFIKEVFVCTLLSNGEIIIARRGQLELAADVNTAADMLIATLEPVPNNALHWPVRPGGAG